MSSNSTSQTRPGAGLTDGLIETYSLQLQIIIFAALALWNAIELLMLVVLTFKNYHGLYFWSLLVASVGIIPYTVGFLLKYFYISNEATNWVGLLLLTIGWWTMVTGQSVVLWSRLHLVVHGATGLRVLRWTGWMIVVSALVFHIPTSVLTWLDNYAAHPAGYVKVFNVFEKLQMTGFFVQEMILSSTYLVATSRILRTSLKDNTRRLLYQLFTINVLIIAGDISLLGIEYANLYVVESMWKPVLYSLKLKLEFAVLGKLIKFVGAGERQHHTMASSAAGVPEQSPTVRHGSVFVDAKRTASDASHASYAHRMRAPSTVEEFDLDLARLEHIHHARLEDGGTRV